MLTHARLQLLLDYDPRTGVFTWRRTMNAAVRAGSRGASGAYKRAGGSEYKQAGIIQIDRKRYARARVAWFWMMGAWPDGEIDHIDRDPHNNAWSNLREATRRQNVCNTKARKDNRSGLKGVRSRRGRHEARIQVNGKSIALGSYATAEEAHAAYCAAAKQFNGEFARTA